QHKLAIDGVPVIGRDINREPPSLRQEKVAREKGYKDYHQRNRQPHRSLLLLKIPRLTKTLDEEQKDAKFLIEKPCANSAELSSNLDENLTPKGSEKRRWLVVASGQ